MRIPDLVLGLTLLAASGWSSLRTIGDTGGNPASLTYLSDDGLLRLFEQLELSRDNSSSQCLEELVTRLYECGAIIESNSDSVPSETNRDPASLSICGLLGNSDTLWGLVNRLTLTNSNFVKLLGEAMIIGPQMRHRVVALFAEAADDTFGVIMQDLKNGLFTDEVTPYVFLSILREAVYGAPHLLDICKDLVLSTLKELIEDSGADGRRLEAFSPGLFADTLLEVVAQPDQKVLVRRMLFMNLSALLLVKEGVRVGWLVPESVKQMFQDLWKEVDDALSNILADNHVTEHVDAQLFWIEPLVLNYLAQGAIELAPEVGEHYCRTHKMWKRVWEVASPSRIMYSQLFRWWYEADAALSVYSARAAQARCEYLTLDGMLSRSELVLDNSSHVLNGAVSVHLSVRNSKPEYLMEDSLRALRSMDRLVIRSVHFFDSENTPETKEDDGAVGSVIEWVTLVIEGLSQKLFLHGDYRSILNMGSTWVARDEAELRLLGVAIGTALEYNVPVFPEFDRYFWEALIGNLYTRDAGILMQYRALGEGFQVVASGFSRSLSLLEGYEIGKIMRPLYSFQLYHFLSDRVRQSYGTALSFTRYLGSLLIATDSADYQEEELLHEVSMRPKLDSLKAVPTKVVVKEILRRLATKPEQVMMLLERKLVEDCREYPAGNPERENEKVYLTIISSAADKCFDSQRRFDQKGSEIFVTLLRTFQAECDPIRGIRHRSAWFSAMGVTHLLRPGSDPTALYESSVPDPLTILRRNLLTDLSLVAMAGQDQCPLTNMSEIPFLLGGPIRAMWNSVLRASIGHPNPVHALIMEPAIINYITSFPRREVDPLKLSEFCIRMHNWRRLIALFKSATAEMRAAIAPWSMHEGVIRFWNHDAQRVIRETCSSVLESPAFVVDRLLESLPPSYYQGDIMTLRRDSVLMDSFARRRMITSTRLVRFQFSGELGADAGGPLREWYASITKKLVDVETGLFELAAGSQNVYRIKPYALQGASASLHNEMMRFAGMVIARALLDRQTLGIEFTNTVYKHLLGQPVGLEDMESDDPEVWKSYKDLLGYDDETIDNLGLTFETTVEDRAGRIVPVNFNRDGAVTHVTHENVNQYIDALVTYKLVTRTQRQMRAFVDGFHSIIPFANLVDNVPHVNALKGAIAGASTVDVADLIAHIEFGYEYTANSDQIQWLFAELRAYSQEELRMFLAFVTGTEAVPLGGFMNLRDIIGQSARIQVVRFPLSSVNDGSIQLPSARTCFFTLNLPEYPSRQVLSEKLELAITDGRSFFAFV